MIRLLLLLYINVYPATAKVQYAEIIDFTVNFFNQDHISLVTAHICWSEGAKRKFSQTLNQNMMRHSLSFNVTTSNTYSPTGIFIDIECPYAEQILNQADKHFMFNPRIKWLILDTNQKILMDISEDFHTKTENISMGYINDLYLLPDSDVAIVMPSPQHELFAYSVFKSGVNTSAHIFPRNESKRQRQNLQGITLNSATVIMYPKEFDGFENTNMKHLDTYPKMHYPILRNLADQMNFTLNVTILNDYGWESNGTFSSVMGLLQRHEIDMAATGFFIRDDRMRVADFTAETYILKTAIIFRQPSLSSVRNIFTMPFNDWVWYSCIAMCFFMIFAFATEVLWIRRFGVLIESLEGAKFMDIVTLVLGAICQQGSHVIPHALSARITLLLLSVASLFLFTSYSANIVALLQSPSSSLITISDLVKSPLAVGIQELNYNHVYLKESTDPNTRKLYIYKILPQGVKAFCTPRTGIQHVRVGYYAFQVEITLGYQLISDTFTEREKCGLSEMELFPSHIVAVPLSKHSGYRNIVTQKIRWQREVGILNQIANKWLPNKPRCESTRGTGFVSVGLMEFFPALCVLLYGISAAIAVFVLEQLYFYRYWFFAFCKIKYKKNCNNPHEHFEAWKKNHQQLRK